MSLAQWVYINVTVIVVIVKKNLNPCKFSWLQLLHPIRTALHVSKFGIVPPNSSGIEVVSEEDSTGGGEGTSNSAGGSSSKAWIMTGYLSEFIISFTCLVQYYNK